MKKVFLHIGHGKTGTSATQTALARLHSDLRAAGLCYPEHPSFHFATLGNVTSGNLDGTYPDWFEAQVLPEIDRNPRFERFLFSNENIFWLMDPFFEAAPSLAARLEFHIILNVREPFDMIWSAYVQMVKGTGYTGEFEDYAKTESHIIHAAYLIKRMRALNLKFTVINYSAVKHGITRRIFDIVGVPHLFDPAQELRLGTVNRSLTHAELQAVLSVNRDFGGEWGRKVSEALVNKLPNVAAESIYLPSDQAQSFSDRIGEAVTTVNGCLAPAQRISMIPAPFDERPPSLGLSEDQASIIHEVFDVRG